MKIGKFSEINKLSVDAIRHYMELGLIVPEKQGGQYFFDAKCQKDLDEILDLKNMGFSLREIKKIFLYKSFSKLAPHQEGIYYKTFFIEKYNQVGNDINELLEVKQRLENKLETLRSNKSNETCILGIDIKLVNLFKCIKCNNDLILCDASVNNNQITHGKLRCNCGEQYVIDTGILKVGEPHPGSVFSFEDDSIMDYINETDPVYLDNLYRGLEWGSRKIKPVTLNKKVILELGSGLGFFLRYIYDELPQDSVYIAVDHSIQKHRFLKSLFESSACKNNIIFICSDFLDIPIKEKCIDIVLDISGTSNYSFEHEEFLMSLVDKYVKEDAYLYGVYILFKSFNRNSLIDKRYRNNFMLEDIKRRLRELKYTPLDERISDYIDKGGKYEDYFVEGERVYTYSFFGKK